MFTGIVSDSQLVTFYQQASVFVFPSLYEGFGLPVLEAMACGCPVITSNTSSLPEVVGEAGMLVNPQNLEELVEAMTNLLTDTVLADYFRKRGREQAENFPGKKPQEPRQICMKELGMADLGLKTPMTFLLVCL